MPPYEHAGRPCHRQLLKSLTLQTKLQKPASAKMAGGPPRPWVLHCSYMALPCHQPSAMTPRPCGTKCKPSALVMSWPVKICMAAVLTPSQPLTPLCGGKPVTCLPLWCNLLPALMWVGGVQPIWPCPWDIDPARPGFGHRPFLQWISTWRRHSRHHRSEGRNLGGAHIHLVRRSVYEETACWPCQTWGIAMVASACCLRANCLCWWWSTVRNIHCCSLPCAWRWHRTTSLAISLRPHRFAWPFSPWTTAGMDRRLPPTVPYWPFVHFGCNGDGRIFGTSSIPNLVPPLITC